MDANTVKGVTTTILLGLSLLTALLLESHMRGSFAGELVLVLIGIVLTAGILFGLWIDEPWAYPLSLVLFAASLINIIWLFISTNEFLGFSFGLLVNVAGLVLCMVGMETYAPAQSLETYEIKDAKKRKRR